LSRFHAGRGGASGDDGGSSRESIDMDADGSSRAPQIDALPLDATRPT
jgi:hypothetical protein